MQSTASRHATVIESHIRANVPAPHSPHCTRPEMTVFSFDIPGFQMKLTAQHLQSNLSTQDTESTVLVKWPLEFVPRKSLFPSPPSFMLSFLASSTHYPIPAITCKYIYIYIKSDDAVIKLDKFCLLTFLQYAEITSTSKHSRNISFVPVNSSSYTHAPLLQYS